MMADDWMACSSIFFADDDEEDTYSNSSVHSADDVSKPYVRVRRGILRNPSNARRPDNGMTSCSTKPDQELTSAERYEDSSFFWPDWDAAKQAQRRSHLYENAFETGNEGEENGSSAAHRKKHTVRFLQQSDADMPATERQQCVMSGNCLDKVHSQSPARRRLNIGRIAEHKFNDGKNPGYTSDTSSTITTDTTKKGRKWYHFSFRANKDRSKNGTNVDCRPPTSDQPIYDEPKFVDEEVEWRCRGRREMRETSVGVNGGPGSLLGTAIQRHDQLPSPLEPHQMSRYRQQRPEGFTDNLNHPRDFSTSSNDLRRSPTPDYKGRVSRVTVRRSRSCVGSDSRRQPVSTAITDTSFSSSTASTNYSLLDSMSCPQPATTSHALVVNSSGSLFTIASNRQQTIFRPYSRADSSVHHTQPVRRTGDVDTVVEHTQLDKSCSSRHLGAATTSAVTSSGSEQQPWTLPRQQRTPTLASTTQQLMGDRCSMTSHGGTNSSEVIPPVASVDVSTDYIFRSASFMPATRLQCHDWTTTENCSSSNVGPTMPEIRVTPATDERRRRRSPTARQRAVTTSTTQAQRHNRDYSAIYAWSPELSGVSTTSTAAMKRSATFGNESTMIRSDANGYIDPSGHRIAARSDQPITAKMEPMTQLTLDLSDSPATLVDSDRWPCSMVYRRDNSSLYGDFVDMRGVCRAIVNVPDLLQIEMFYRSNKTEVFPCACSARLYFASVRRHSSLAGNISVQPEVTDAVRWYPTTAVGVPVVVLDCGGSRCRERKLNLVLAEVGSGFALWRDTIDHLTGYRVVTSAFHALQLSHDHSRLAGLRFADSNAGENFRRKLDAITAGPLGDTLLNLSAERRVCRTAETDTHSSHFNAFYKTYESDSAARTVPKSKKLQLKLKKCDISAPCCFEHITKFESVPGFLV